jgi:predicted AAA+ superfamily ATPase
MIERPFHVAEVVRLLRSFPAVALLGARQVGKTTLARAVAERMGDRARFLDLESDRDLQLLGQPEAVLSPLRGLVVIDEVQRMPTIFPPLRPLLDRRPLPARFLLLGSASPEVSTRGSESLAGRIAFHELDGLALGEVGTDAWRRLWLRGGFPRSYTARSDAASMEWREAFLRTYMERDVLDVGLRMPPAELRRFWQMLAHWHGQRWNASEFARAFGISEATVRRWLETLEGFFAVRILRPWAASIAKRQVKAPKVYIRDCGMLHAVLGVTTTQQLRERPQVGASFEGFVIEQAIHTTGARASECFHWATPQGAELDLLLARGDRRIGIEVKCTEAPTVTPSMTIAMDDLQLERLWVVHQGTDRFEMRPGIEALPIGQLHELRGALRAGTGRVARSLKRVNDKHGKALKRLGE